MEWKKGKDVDFPGDSYFVVFFKPNDVYKVEGQTHGLASHAIKHLHEIKPGIESLITRQFNKLIANQKELWLNSKPTESRQFTFDVVLNTLDHINDKAENRKEMLPIEREILKQVIQPMADVYNKWTEDFVDGATKITSDFTVEEIKQLIRKGTTISFYTKYHDMTRQVFVNVSKGIFLTTTGDKRFIFTCYRNTPSTVVANILRQEILNPNVKKALA